MKLAFCLYKYFPYGGLQRDFLRIARACLHRRHEIHVYTTQWEGEQEPALQTHLIPVEGWQNHTRMQAYVDGVGAALTKTPADLVVGFNKMPHLDVYYAADVCYQARVREQRHFLYRCLPRYRQYAALEKSVFAAGNKTEIMLISSLQEKAYRDIYHTEAKRFHLLPPGISRDRIAPYNASEKRAAMREALRVGKNDFIILMVGSGFKTKGVDRAILAMAALPEELKKHCHLIIIGQDNPSHFLKLARQHKIEQQTRFMGGRDDIPDFLLAADVLLHPSYHENTGTAILEAMVAGLPVLTVDVCGYAHYVEDADAGLVLKTPFVQTGLNELLQKMLISKERARWAQNGLAFAQHADIYHLPEKAADLIEFIGRKRDSIFA